MAGKKKLAAYVHVGGRVFAPGDSPAKEFADQILNPKAWEGGVAPKVSSDAGDSGDVVYGDMKNADLEALIAERNEGRDDAAEIKPESTKKDDLVAALEADDAATSGE